MVVTIDKVYNKIWMVTFDNQFEQCSTLMRVQEHYQSPNQRFREKPFTHEEYIQWFVTTKGSFTYFHDWLWFNHPASFVKTIKRDFNGLWKRELEYYYLCKKAGVNFKDDYIIGCVKGDSSTMRHEFAHGLYFSDPVYKRKSDSIINRIPKHISKKFKTILGKIGYREPFMTDEFQAHLVDGLIIYQSEFKSKDFDILEELSDEMYFMFQKFYNKIV